jgi:hypothetical protein
MASPLAYALLATGALYLPALIWTVMTGSQLARQVSSVALLYLALFSVYFDTTVALSGELALFCLIRMGIDLLIILACCWVDQDPGERKKKRTRNAPKKNELAPAHATYA